MSKSNLSMSNFYRKSIGNQKFGESEILCGHGVVGIANIKQVFFCNKCGKNTLILCCAACPGASIVQKFDFIIRRDNKKISYECHVYDYE